MRDYPKCNTCDFCTKSNDGYICGFDNNNLPMADNEGDCENHTAKTREIPDYIIELNSKYKRPRYRPSSVIEKPHDNEWYK